MLGPRFKEGVQLQSSSRAEIPLPEDDPAAMEVICQIIHYQHASFPKRLEPEKILKIAIAVDKYDWCQALMLPAQYWLNTALYHAGLAERRILLHAAYLFQHKAMFRQVGQRMMNDAKSDLNDPSGRFPTVIEKLLCMPSMFF